MVQEESEKEKSQKESNETTKEDTEENIQEGDWIEIEFTGKVSDTGEVFDSNRQKDLEEMGSQSADSATPYIFCIGQDMFLNGIEEEIKGKTPGEYTIELPPEKAFGNRDPSKIQVMPYSVFKNQQVKPYPGAMFNFDGQIGKILSVSGGRVRVDFNNPVAGKDVIYSVGIKRKVTDKKEQINAFNDFLFKKQPDFKIDKENNKIFFDISSIEKSEQKQKVSKLLENFKQKYKDLFGMDVEVSGNESKDTGECKKEGVENDSKENGKTEKSE